MKKGIDFVGVGIAVLLERGGKILLLKRNLWIEAFIHSMIIRLRLRKP